VLTAEMIRKGLNTITVAKKQPTKKMGKSVA